MRKLIYSSMVSLDGFVARPNGDLGVVSSRVSLPRRSSLLWLVFDTVPHFVTVGRS